MADPDVVLNVKKSPRDRRDYVFKGSYGNLPAGGKPERLYLGIPTTLDLRPDLQPIRNQGSQGTCYAQTVACVKEWQEKKDSGFDEYMSPQFFYNNRTNNHDDNPRNDDGMFGRDVMKLMLAVGICRESKYPYGVIQKRYDIPQSCFEEAKKHKIKSYAKIKDLEALKESLVKNGPALIAFPTYNLGPYFWRNLGESRRGGHAVTVVGYNQIGFIIRNSWGTGWGNQGYTTYPFHEWGSHWECWTTVDIEGDDVYIPSPRRGCCTIV